MTRARLIVWTLAFAIGAGTWRFTQETPNATVVVYVSHDQVFSEPILKDFEEDTGINVRAVYDTEES
jgi:iron(III) transport system substrate-binding protein